MTSTNCSETDLRAAGWERCFIAGEPRLSEAVETYREIGFDVLLLPVGRDAADCTECMRWRPDGFSVIYIRRRDAADSQR